MISIIMMMIIYGEGYDINYNDSSDDNYYDNSNDDDFA